jgi:hypothetical protein
MTNDAGTKKTPVPVTRGSGNPILSQKLHWLEGTFKKGNEVSLPETLPSKFVETRAFNGYTVGSLFEDGRILMTNPERPEMGAHLQWSGDACDKIPMEQSELVFHLGEAGFSFTRIDLAIDAINFNLRPQQATKELKYGRCKTRAKLSPTNSDPRDKGYTQYVGKKTSEIFLKLYDKAEEMGVDADHCRIELTVRHARADHAARQIVRGTDFRAMVVAYADFPKWRQWKEIMGAVPVKLPAERHETNTEQWLLGACAPALARVIYFASNTEFYEKFKDAVMMNLEELSNGRRTVH